MNQKDEPLLVQPRIGVRADPLRIHVLGGSGCGVSTLGAALGRSLGLPVFDNDDYYWEPTEPPFQKATAVPQRQAKLLGDLASHAAWVSAGSMDSWSQPFEPLFTHVIFLQVPTTVRCARLRERERKIRGARIVPGADMHDAHEKFIAWAAQYDAGTATGRSLPRHEAWLARQRVPVLRIEGDFSAEETLARAMKFVTAPFVRVLPYDPTWPRRFDELNARLWPAVREVAIAIEHVGSTSVPGLAAKPVIDVDIVIRQAYDLPKMVAILAELGYDHCGNYGIEGREAFRARAATFAHNLYVCLQDSVALANHLCLRDALRANEELRNEYAALKLELARKHFASIDDYIEGKTEFILRILAKAGHSSSELESIRAANRAPSRK